MVLVKFVSASGNPVWVNPEHVAALEVATAGDFTSIALSNSSFVMVKGHVDATAGALLRATETPREG